MVGVEFVTKKQCIISDDYYIKSALGTSYLLTFNPGTIVEHEILVPKSQAKYSDKYISAEISDDFLKHVSMRFSQLHNIKHLAIALRNPSLQKTVLTTVNIDGELVFNLNKLNRWLWLGFLINDTNGLIKIGDNINQYLDLSTNVSVKDLFQQKKTKVMKLLINHLSTSKLSQMKQYVTNNGNVELQGLILSDPLISI